MFILNISRVEQNALDALKDLEGNVININFILAYKIQQ